MIWVDAFLSPFRTWRRFRGGHWERWYIDHPVSALAWLRLERCSLETRTRPPGAHGRPECEAWA